MRDLEEGKDWMVEVVEGGEKSSGRKRIHIHVQQKHAELPVLVNLNRPITHGNIL